MAGPQQANIQTPTTTKQAQDQYDQAQAALQQQQAFANANQPGGLAALQSQQQLLGQLGQAAQGQGPNPALAQLAQSTGQNVSNQAALMAGQRGAGANAGLIARQAAQQGASTQQQAAGQAATLSAQQQIQARQQLAAQQQAMVNQQAGSTGAYTNAAMGEQQNILNAIQGQNQAQVGSAASTNAANAALAGQTMGAQQQLMGNAISGAGAALALAKGGSVLRPMYYDGSMAITPGGTSTAISNDEWDKAAAQAAAPVSQAAASPSTPAVPGPTSPASGPQSSVGKFFKGATSSPDSSDNSKLTPGQQAMGKAGTTIGTAIGKGLSALFGGSSGSSDSSDGGTTATNQTPAQQASDQLNADLMLGDSNQSTTTDMGSAAPTSSQDAAGGNTDLTVSAAKGGRVPALVSPGEQYLPPKDVKKVVKDGKNPLSVGERIPGKPKHPGNDYRNDTVKKTLQSGGMVIPNDVMQSKNPHFEAMKFVHAHIAKHRGLSK